jgi:hypothetical protein
MEYEWRAGPKPKQTGFWVLLWSKDPRQLWWELRDEFERQTLERHPQRRANAKTKGRSPKVEPWGERPLPL